VHPFHRWTLSAVTLLGIPFAAAAQSAASGNAFNPKISLILNGTYAHYGSDLPADMPGFLLGDEAGFIDSGLSLGETELAIEANVDDKFHGWATVSMSQDGEVGVEEAYINTLALPHGLALKMGRFFSDIGYQNHQHAHAWEFADAPLVYRALLGGQLGDDGVQLRWLAPTDLLIEVGGEALRGAAFPGGGEHRDDVKAWTAFAHVGGDAGVSGSWRFGLWHLRTDADARPTGEDFVTLFTGDSQVSGIDAVYKWAPQGNPAETNLVVQAEVMTRKENGDVTFDPGASAASSRYDGRQSGFYVQTVYQFMPRWRVGARYDRVQASNTVDDAPAGTSLATLADDATDPQRYSVMADFSNSEFSRFRLQFNRDQSRPGREPDNQVLVQYIFSLGSHPAHQF
jgi:hypothetical protein